MIELLHQLANTASIERLNVSIQPETDARTHIVIQSILAPAKGDLTATQKSIRAALSTPISISGCVGEVEAKLDGLLSAYVDKASHLSSALITNADALTHTLDQCDNDNAPDDEDQSEAPKQPSRTEAFANGDADSL